jgi:hypothetical protein
LNWHLRFGDVTAETNRLRLRIVGFVKEFLRANVTGSPQHHGSTIEACPFCGSKNHTATIELAKLTEKAAEIESQWVGINAVPAMLDAEDQIRQIRDERGQLEQLTAGTREADEERAIFIGNPRRCSITNAS